MSWTRILGCRALVYGLAWLSFACLLGQFYGLWSMRVFGCWVLPPATAMLACIAFSKRQQPRTAQNPHTWIVQGAIGGIVAAFAYDLYRLPFVLTGAPLFRPFVRFGRLLLGANDPAWLVYLLGWTYHLSNGAALGIMFLALLARPSPRSLFWGAVAWAMFVEFMLLLTPYTTFFGLKLNNTFIVLTLTAHLVFGIILGLWYRHSVLPHRSVS